MGHDGPWPCRRAKKRWQWAPVLQGLQNLHLPRQICQCLLINQQPLFVASRFSITWMQTKIPLEKKSYNEPTITPTTCVFPAFCGRAMSITDFARNSLSFRCLQASLSRARNRGNQFGRLLTSRGKAAAYLSKKTHIKKKHTSSTAQGGGGSFKNRKPIGEVGCCE